MDVQIPRQVLLTDEANDFIESKVSSGQYVSADAVILDALRHLEIRQQDEAAKLKWLQEAWREGVESGDAGPLDIDSIIAEARSRYLPQS